MDSIEDIKSKLQSVFEKEPIVKAILFGSYAKGVSTDQSDIDIVIESNGKLLGLDFFRVLDEIVQALNLDVDLFEKSEIITGSKMDQTINREGITLYERKVA